MVEAWTCETGATPALMLKFSYDTNQNICNIVIVLNIVIVFIRTNCNSKKIQNAKVQRTYVETVYSCVDCSFSVLFAQCKICMYLFLPAVKIEVLFFITNYVLASYCRMKCGIFELYSKQIVLYWATEYFKSIIHNRWYKYFAYGMSHFKGGSSY